MKADSEVPKREEFTRIAINFDRREEVVIAQVSGELDFGTIRHFNEKMETLQKAGLSKFVLDVTAVSYMDSSGIATLIKQHRDAAEREGRVVVLWPKDPTLRKAIERTRIATKMAFRETLDEALPVFVATDQESDVVEAPEDGGGEGKNQES